MNELGHTIENVMHRSMMSGGTPALLRSEEAAGGRMVIRPGEVPWLPLEEWSGDTVVSIEDDRVRLVLLVAVRPGHGAFSRLIARLARARLKPVVVEPSSAFAATLERRRWRSRSIGHGAKTQTIWYPRRRA